MSGVPEFMSQGQILPPEGLQATLKLFHIDNDQEEIYLYSHREESGGTAIKSNSKRVRHESDVNGEFAVMGHYHMDGASPNSEGSVYGGLKGMEEDVMNVGGATDRDDETVETDETDSEDESDSDGDAIGQGGAPLYSRPTTRGLRLPTKKAEKKSKTMVTCDMESSNSESESDEDYEAICMRRQREREQLRRKDLDIPAPFPKFGIFFPLSPWTVQTWYRYLPRGNAPRQWRDSIYDACCPRLPGTIELPPPPPSCPPLGGGSQCTILVRDIAEEVRDQGFVDKYFQIQSTINHDILCRDAVHA
jgi:hypothetical protein